VAPRFHPHWQSLRARPRTKSLSLRAHIHHADIITIEGQSYRRSAAEQRAAARKTTATR
jgi:hypothetical protein